MSTKILTKTVVSKWIYSVLENEYTMTIYPNTREISEKDIRILKDAGWRMVFLEGKIIITSRDPLSIAKLAVKMERKGYFVDID